jgi:hypothetical protein
MITMIRNGEKKKITKKQFRNYCLHLKLRNEIKKEKEAKQGQ